MLLSVDGGNRTLGWAVVEDRTGRVLELGDLFQEPIAGLDDTTDRATRARNQARLFVAISRRHRITGIAAEAVSLGGAPKARLAMAIGINLCWGELVMLAEVLDVPLYEVPPKIWQRAIVPDSARSIEYDEVERRLTDYISGPPVDQLLAIPKARRNHALDAVGVGVYTAMNLAGVTRVLATDPVARGTKRRRLT